MAMKLALGVKRRRIIQRRNRGAKIRKEGMRIIPSGTTTVEIEKKVPKGARIFLLRREGISTTPFYLYAKRYRLGGSEAEKLYLVLDFRNLHFSPSSKKHVFQIHEIVKSLGLEKTAEQGRLAVKTHNTVFIERNLFHEMLEKTKKAAAEEERKKHENQT